MTIEEVYEEFNGNYADVLSRLGKPDFIVRMVQRFPASSGMDQLPLAVREGRGEEAFRLAHTLKGLSLNLGFTALAVSSSALTEALRGREVGQECPGLLKAVERDYDAVLSAIAKLDR